MVKKNEINSIDDKIKKLQDKKRALQEKKEKEIGKYLLKSWGISSLNNKDIFYLIDNNSPKNASK
ncbi:hypothetical protein NNC19_06495 [Clostridium sp. SHJSY1]|uniref:hypothetical protein n=1 Tax=Clostridium sp. SHJSY1 TaxID=2942483 RepID=UPI00287614CC|nr:hypothetical protein [Clostridium sp. SHJSY1]MDS0525321.1 hypothetical protein [Clostridium sp. SHJSY1]